MATNLIQQGNTIEYANSSGGTLAAGRGVPVITGATGFIGVAINDIPNNTTGVLAAEGVFELPANAGTGLTFARGDVLYWDNSTPCLTKTTTGNTKAGTAWAPKLAAGTTAVVKLLGGAV